MKTKLLTFFLLASSALMSLGCSSKFSFRHTKIAVFADNQLTRNSNNGGTAYSPAYLRQHLAACKAQNVDVIMISGDLVNNAVSDYYKYFEEILEDIYGEDESLYPEFVYTMGNHEWYQTDEKTEEKAISYFKKHARIKTKCLKKEATFTIPGQSADAGADYYKVINGIPFLSISGSSSSGMISYDEQDELTSWIKDINKLPSVKAGGPIFVSYHYALKDVTYSFGQGASDHSETLIELLKDLPQTIVFTGDTHFSGVNERTINQVDFTNVNLGSSCYSRHVNRSATMSKYQTYYNMLASHGSKDKLDGEVADNYNKTPHFHIVEVNDDGSTTLNRYFTTLEPNEMKHIGLTWTIPNAVTKDDFIYTNDRFLDKSWANKMYQKEGLSWDTSATATARKVNGGLRVKFPDVTDFNYCEHYKITVTADTSKEFDFVSHYYKWEEQAHEYDFEIEDIDLPVSDSYQIRIDAYDYFDNKSTNYLSTSISKS